MATDTNRLRVDQDGLFTVSSTSCWPAGSANRPLTLLGIKLDDALVQLGFGKDCGPYSQTAAAVAHFLLEAIEDRLPVWACWKGDNLIGAAGIASRIRSRNVRRPFCQVAVRHQLGILRAGL